MLDQEWCEDEYEAGMERLALIVDLLAWTVAQSVKRQDLSLPKNRPPVDIYDDRILMRLALRDPLLFELIRHQVAQGLASEPDHLAHLAADLLVRERPLKRTKASDNLARDFLIVAAWRISEEFGFWYDPSKSSWAAPREKDAMDVTHQNEPNYEALGHPATSLAKSAEALFDLLNQHPRLLELPDEVPSPSAIKAVIVRYEAIVSAAGLSCLEAAELLSDFV